MVSLEKYTIVINYRVCLKSGNRDEHRTIFTGPRKQEFMLIITFLYVISASTINCCSLA